MLDRLTASCAENFPLPTGRRRVALIAGFVIASALAAGFGLPRLAIAPLSAVFDANDLGEVRYVAYKQRFNSEKEAIALIDTGEGGANEARAREAAFALGESLEDEGKIASVHWGLNPAAANPKLIRTLPTDELTEIAGQVTQLKPLLDSESPGQLLQAGMAEAMAGLAASGGGDGSSSNEAIKQGAEVFIGLMATFTKRMETPADQPVDLWAALQEAAGQSDWELLRSASGRLLVLRINLRDGVDGKPGYGGSLAAVRKHVEAVRLRFEDVELGLTGYEPTSREAEAVIRSASMRAVGGALLGLLVLTALAWRSVWLPGVVVVLPGVATALLLGGVGMVLGTVNALAMIGVVTTGLVTLYAGLMLGAVSAKGEDRRAGLRTVLPVVTGALLVLVLVGVGLFVAGEAVLGWWPTGGEAPPLERLRSAGGVALAGGLIAWVTVVFLGPALLPEQRNVSRTAVRGEMALTLASGAARRPGVAWAVAGLAAVGLAVSAWFTPQVSDANGFLPVETEGAVWQRRALAQGGEWGLPLSSLATSMDEAAARAERLRALPEVGQVAGIGRLLASDSEAKVEVLNKLEATLEPSVADAVDAVASPTTGGPSLVDQVRLIRAGLGFLPESATESLGDLAPAMAISAEAFVHSAETLDPAERDARLAALAEDYAATRRAAGRLVQGTFDPAPLTADDLEGVGGLFDAWVSRPSEDGSIDSTAFLLKLHPAAGTKGWITTDEVAAFRDAVGEIDPDATGTLDRLLARGRGFVSAMKALVVLVAVALGITLFLSQQTWRSVAGGLVVLAGSAVALVAVVGWLSQPMSTIGWGVWPVIGALAVVWVATWGVGVDDVSRRLRRAAGTEAFGFVLASGFLIAAGLRSAGAPGLTATAVAACVAVGFVGIGGLLLVAGPRRGER